MLVLSFRDMSVARCSAVTSAAVYQFGPIDAAYAWDPPAASTLQLVGWSDAHTALRGKHVCFLVHGFNVDRDHGYTSLGALAQGLLGEGPINLLANGVDVVVPVLWAGDWYLPINYPFLLPDIRETARNFTSFIVSAATQMAKVSFMSHSLGARVVLETMRQTLALKSKYAVPDFDCAILTAAAVSDGVLDDPDYADAVASLRQIVVASARTDSVLSQDFPLGNLVEQALWTDDRGDETALGQFGPRLKAGSAALAKTLWYDITSLMPAIDQQHGDYLPAPYAAEADFPDGWSVKRERVGELTRAALNGRFPDTLVFRSIVPQTASP